MNVTLLLLSSLALARQPDVLFEPNLGQANSSVRFLARTSHATYAFTEKGIQTPQVQWTFPGAAPTVWQATQPHPVKVSSFLGPPSTWQHDLPTFSRLEARQLYPGIDLAAYPQGSHLEFDFIVHPQADPSLLRLRFSHPVRLGADGTLLVATAGGEHLQRPPVAYQTTPSGRQPVTAAFILVNDHEAAFRLGAYDPLYPLIIDPVVERLTYLGGDDDDDLVAVDRDLTCGSTASAEFRLSLSSPPNLPPSGSRDIFLITPFARYYIGGTGDDRPTACTLAGGNGIFVAGTTTSSDFPVGKGGYATPLKPTPELRTDYRPGDHFLLFVPSSTSISSFPQWTATYTTDAITSIATSGWPSRPVITAAGSTLTVRDHRFAITATRTLDGLSGLQLKVDGSRLYVAGLTADRHVGLHRLALPSLESAAQTVYRGDGEDVAHALQLQNTALWVVGSTTSPDLPLAGPWQATHAGGRDAFVAGFDPTTLELLRSSYHGGSGDDVAYGIAQQNGDWVVAGSTTSRDLPTTPDADQRFYSGGSTDGFYFVVPPAETPLRLSSYFGGPGDDVIVGLGTNFLAGNATAPLDLPLLPDRTFRERRDTFSALLRTRPDTEITLANGGAVTYSLPNADRPSDASPVTFRTSDPGLFKLSGVGADPVETTTNSGTVTLVGLASSGSASLIVAAPGRPEMRLPVRLLPGGFYLRQFPLTLPPASTGYVVVTGFAALDPATGAPLADQAPAASSLKPTLESSDPAVVEVVETNLRSHAAGVATLRLRQPEGFRDTPPVEILVRRTFFDFTCPALGQHLRTSAAVSTFGRAVPFTATVAGPVRFSTSAIDQATYAAITYNAGPINQLIFDTSAASGTATFTFTGNTDLLEPATFTCPVSPSYFDFSDPARIRSWPANSELRLALASRIPGWPANTFTRSPQAPADTVRISATGDLPPIPDIAVAAGATSPEVRVTPRTPGRGRYTVLSSGGSTLDLTITPPAPFVIGTLTLGQYLSATLTLRTPNGGFLDNTTVITARASAGLLLRAPNGQSRTEITYPARDGNPTVESIGQLGDGEIELAWEDGGAQGRLVLPVKVVPSQIGFTQATQAVDLVYLLTQDPPSLDLSGFINVDGTSVSQPVAPALYDHLQPRSSPAGRVAITRSATGFLLRPLTAGPAEITLDTTLPIHPAYRRLRLLIKAAGLQLRPGLVGVHLLSKGFCSLTNLGSTATSIRLTTSDPAVLGLSVTPGQLPLSTIELSSNACTFYLHGMAVGVADLTAESAAATPVTLPISVLPSTAAFQFNTAAPLESTLQGVTVPVILAPLDVNSGAPLPALTLRPGLSPQSVTLTAEPSGSVVVTPAEFVFNPGTESVSVRLRPTGPGRARITINPPAGFTPPRTGATLTLTTNAQRLVWSNINPLGLNTFINLTVRTSDGQLPPGSLTVTTSDPTRLRLAQNFTGGLADRLTFPNSTAASFMGVGLANEGTVTLIAEAPGLEPATLTIPLERSALGLLLPSALNLGESRNVGFALYVTNSPATLYPSPTEFTLRATPAGIVDLPATARLNENFSIRALRPGTVRISVDPGPAYDSHVSASRELTVTLADINTPSAVRVGRALITSLSAYTVGSNSFAATASSSNPSIVQLSLSPTDPAQTSVAFTTSASTRLIWVHGLSVGLATLTLSGPDVNTRTIAIEVLPSGFIITNSGNSRSVPVGSTETLNLASVIASSTSSSDQQALRPGVTALPTLISSAPAIVSLAPTDALTWQTTTRAPGRARITVQQPAGFTAPSGLTALEYEVTDAYFNFSPPRVAAQLRSSATASLVPAKSNVPVRLVSLSPDRLQIAETADAPGQAEITINSGSSNSVGFFLDGLAASGLATLRLSAPGYPSVDVDVTLQPSGFIFRDTSITLSPGNNWSAALRAVPLSAALSQPVNDSADYRLRPTARDARLSFEVLPLGDNSTAGLRLTDVLLQNGPPWLPTATWSGSGRATVRILQPPGFTTPSRNGTIDVTLR